MEKFCTSMCCSGDRSLILCDENQYHHFMVAYFDMKKELNCFNNERLAICNLCRLCSDCKDFIFLVEQFNSYKDRHLNKDRNDVIISFNFKFNELKYLRKKNIRSTGDMDMSDKIIYGHI